MRSRIVPVIARIEMNKLKPLIFREKLLVLSFLLER